MYRTAVVGLVAVVLSCCAHTDAERAAASRKPRPLQRLRDRCRYVDKEACRRVGEAYLEGAAVRRDLREARYWLEKSCRLNSSEGCNRLGKTYEQGIRENRDLKRALALFQRACSLRHPPSCYDYGHLLQGGGERYPHDIALIVFAYACRSGITRACTALGWMYERGHGVTPDSQAAAALFRHACDRQETDACRKTTPLTIAPRQPWRRYAEVHARLEAMCKERDLPACNNLARAYLEGLGVPRDSAHALTLFRSSCDRGSAHGCHNLAAMYCAGIAVVKNSLKSVLLMKRACSLGFTPSKGRKNSAPGEAWGGEAMR